MLEFSLESHAKRRQLRQWPVGNSLDDFAQWLPASGYTQRPAQLILRGTAHFSHWTWAQGVPLDHIDDERIDTFARHLPTCGCRHGFLRSRPLPSGRGTTLSRSPANRRDGPAASRRTCPPRPCGRAIS